MQERTIFILVAMMAVVLITSAFGAYRDGDGDDDSVSKKRGKSSKIHDDAPSSINKSESDSSGVVGASGAGTSHKTAKAYLDTSGRANGPYVDDGENAYKGKARGHELDNGSDSDSDNGSDSDSDSGSSSDGESDGGNNQDDFKRKLKYIKKSVSNLFKDIFSKWGNQGSVMAPSGIEEMNPDAIPSNATVDGFRVKEKMKKQARQGMRKIKSAFRGRRKE